MHQLTKPAKEPVSVEEVFADRRETITAEFNLIKRLIVAAREECENICRRIIAPRQFEIVLDNFAGDIALVPPAASVTHVKYYDSANVLQTVDSGDYNLFGANGLTPRIAARTGWPTARDLPDSVIVTVTLGYVDGTCPEAIRSWIITRVGTMFEFREQLVSGTIIAELPYVNALLDQYIIAGAYASG